MLYLMRHGQTDWNREYRLQGRTDIPLNDTGREMAAKARERYPDLSVDICYCSPLSRARETAEIFLAGRNVPIVPDGRIAEMSFGKYEGIQSVIDHPELPIRDLFVAPERYVADGGSESFPEAFARTDDFLREQVIPRLARGENVLLVAHGAINCCLYTVLTGTPLEKLWDSFCGNCEILEVPLFKNPS